MKSVIIKKNVSAYFRLINGLLFFKTYIRKNL